MDPHISLPGKNALAADVSEMSDQDYDLHCASLFGLAGGDFVFLPTGMVISANQSQTTILLRHIRSLQKGQPE